MAGAGAALGTGGAGCAGCALDLRLIFGGATGSVDNGVAGVGTGGAAGR